MTNQEKSSADIAVLYHYFEAHQSYQQNFQHFLNFGTAIPADIFCLISEKCSFELPKLPNVKYFTIRNHNLDYGGYAYALNNLIDWKCYGHIAFINSSVRGPFIPPYCNSDWTQNFLNLFDSETGLVGSSINVLPLQSSDSLRFNKQFPQYRPPYSHVQTTAYMLSQKALRILMQRDFFANDAPLHKAEIIVHYEILLSQLVLNAGLKIRCLLPEYNLIDFSTKHDDPNPTAYSGDPLTPNGYWGRTIHPYEGIFIKTERGLYPPHWLDLLAHSMSVRDHQSLAFPMHPLDEILREKYRHDMQSNARELFKHFRKSFKKFLKANL